MIAADSDVHTGVHLLELATTEGCSLVEASAALPDLHVKQAVLSPPLLHPHRFFMSSSSQRPPSQSLISLSVPHRSFDILVALKPLLRSHFRNTCSSLRIQ